MGIINKIATKFIGSRNERLIKQYNKTVLEINSYEEELKKLSDNELLAKTEYFKNELKNGKTLDDILPETFAVVREASVRTLGLRHFDVQLIGGMVLHNGNIAEMRTGEGKTLVATLAAYLNSLVGKGVHIVTVNDYLAQRDANWMGKIYEFLGLRVGIIISNMELDARRDAYACDIIYGTNNELGFDYLKDNMVFELEQKVQRGVSFAIVDEVDSILIDEARTPLIISGPADDYGDIYHKINQLIPKFEKQLEENGSGDYSVDEKHKGVFLTDEGHDKAEKLLIQANLLKEGSSLYDSANILLTQHLNSALRAHVLFQKDVDYIKQNDEIVIVDEFTGRTMPGRRWSEGLHQAIEAKEGVSVKKENQTLASITFQNYFRLYDKLSGMTGTADTEAYEFQDIYSLEVVVIPTNKPTIRQDFADAIYLTQTEKYQAIIDDIKETIAKKQPVLVGTSSIESSELIAKLLNKKKIKHEVLNAKQHEREALIIANAGLPSAVTIATNMAGRGTDIVLGGKLEDNASDTAKEKWSENHKIVIEAGGLHVIGTERNESRRVDNQLRGRAGRQGDPGSSRYYLSLEDNLMRIFASERMSAMMSKLGMQEGEAIEHPWVSRAIENAQKKVEGHNFDARKNLLEYDDVANDQRKIIYEQRDMLMQAEDVISNIKSIREDIINKQIDNYIPVNVTEEDWDISGLAQAFKADFSSDLPLQEWLDEGIELDDFRKKIITTFEENYQEKEELAGHTNMRHFEKGIMLQTLDHFWKEHLASMDYLRQSINLRGYAQKNPTQEFKKEAFEMFGELLDNINFEVVKIVSNVQVVDEDIDAYERQKPQQMSFQHAEQQSALSEEPNQQVQKPQPFKRKQPKIGRNDPCHCGSGKKYKQCHGRRQ